MKPQRQMIRGPIQAGIKEGQEYADVPVYKQTFVYGTRGLLPAKVVRYYVRTPLRWMKPGPDGKLVPR